MESRLQSGTGRCWLLMVCGVALSLYAAGAKGDEITVVSWGGAHAQGLEKSYYSSFEETSGIDINPQHYSGGLDQLREQVTTESVIWDVVDLTDEDAERACAEGLLEVLPLDQLPTTADEASARDDFLPGSLLPCAVGYAVWSTVLAFRTDEFPEKKPSRLNDLFDLDNFPGKRGLRRSPQGLLEWALLADGVQTEHLYDELSTESGLRRAFDKLRTIKAHIVWWRDLGDMAALLADGTVSMGSAYSTSMLEAVARGDRNIRVVWDSHLMNTHYFGVTKGTFRFASAWQFVRFVSHADRMPLISNYLGYGPTRRAAQARIRDEFHPLLPTAEANFALGVHQDNEWWDKNRTRINQRFAEWLVDMDG